MYSPSVASASTGGNPFLALNDDALRDFFELMGDIDPPHRREHNFASSGEVPFCLGWIYLTHVNQRWRRLLLAMPSLWAKVFANVPASAYEETFSRAGDASWHLSFDNEPSSRRQKLVTLAQSHMEQVRALRVSDPTDTSDWVFPLHGRNLPELVTLDISQDPVPDSDILLRCPNLRDCTLYNLPAQFVAPSLRRLVMRGDPALPDSVPTLLDTLVSLPYLEELELELLSRKPLVWGDDQGSPVTLASLRSIVLFGTLDSDMVGFWRRLVLPPVLENMRITYSGNVGWGPIVDAFAPYLAREPYNALAFRSGENEVFELCAFTFKDDGPAAFHPGAGRRGTWLGIAPNRYNGQGEEVEEGDEEEEDDEPLLQDILPPMLSHLKARAEHITHLFFNTCNSYTLDDDNEDPPHPARIALRDELRAFTSVTVVCGAFWRFDFNVLSLSNKHCRDSLDQDSDSEEEDEDNDLSPKLLPNLTTLVAYLNRDHSIRWRELHPLFKDRALARTPIQRLELIGPILPLDDDARGRSAASSEKGLVQAKSFGLREFVDRRVPLSEWQAHGPAFELFGIDQAY